MNYNINLGGWNSIFAVPSDVVDKYIKIASGSNIKVLLYFLRHCGELLNDEIIATALSMNEEDVKDALSFWVQVGLLTMSDGVYSPMQAVPEAARPQEKEPAVSGVSASVTVPAGVTAKDAEFAAVKAAALRSPEFSPAEIADTIKSDDKIDYLHRRRHRAAHKDRRSDRIPFQGGPAALRQTAETYGAECNYHDNGTYRASCRGCTYDGRLLLFDKQIIACISQRNGDELDGKRHNRPCLC